MNFSERYTWAVSKLKHICPSKMYLWVGYRKFPTHFTIEIIFHKKGIRPAGQPTKPYLIHNTSEVVSQIHSSGWSSGPGRRDPVAQKHESWGLSLHRILKIATLFSGTVPVPCPGPPHPARRPLSPGPVWLWPSWPGLLYPQHPGSWRTYFSSFQWSLFS